MVDFNSFSFAASSFYLELSSPVYSFLILLASYGALLLKVTCSLQRLSFLAKLSLWCWLPFRLVLDSVNSIIIAVIRQLNRLIRLTDIVETEIKLIWYKRKSKHIKVKFIQDTIKHILQQ